MNSERAGLKSNGGSAVGEGCFGVAEKPAVKNYVPKKSGQYGLSKRDFCFIFNDNSSKPAPASQKLGSYD